ncbi:MAG: DUF1501 domain-containing protein [Planctomycetota bacterium]
MNAVLHRRQWIQSFTAAGLSTSLGRMVAGETLTGRDPDPPYRRCMTLWMQGGPSQLDTFDPKPGTESAGPFQAVPTNVPGIQFCQTLPRLATRADQMALLRCVGSNQGEHERATHLMHTGFERIASFPRPSLGSFVSHLRRQSTLPGFVTLGDQVFGPAFLGSQHGPFVIGDVDRVRETLRRVQRHRDRLDLIGDLNRHSAASLSGVSVRQRADEIDSIRRLIESPFATALDLEQENHKTRERYGDSQFGRRVLAGRRLLESGVKYVEVQMPGWDTHVDNFPAVNRLCQQLEPAMIALMDDLMANGLWNDTLILWMGEFGRTPRVNGGRGRDHFPQSIPVVMAGHGFGGRVIGSTGPEGRDVGESRSVADLMYTLMVCMGIDAESEWTTAFGSPTTATEGGGLIEGVLG